MIDISDVQMIKVISEAGSINRAAELLHMSQPTLSKKLSRLEHKIKLDLFKRHTSGMVPTAAAKFLLKEADDLAVQLQVIERQLELMADMVGGQIKLGVGPIVEQLILPKVLLDFAERDYQFKISVVTESPEVLLKQLKNSEIDIAIGPFQAQEINEDFEAVLSTSEKIVGVARKEHALLQSSHKEALTVETLRNHKFVSPSIPKNMGRPIIEFLEYVDIQPNIICDNYAMAKNIVLNSNYITAGPASLFRSEFVSGELVELDFPANIYWHCNFLAKPETLLLPAVKEIVSIFGQYMDTIPAKDLCP